MKNKCVLNLLLVFNSSYYSTMTGTSSALISRPSPRVETPDNVNYRAEIENDLAYETPHLGTNFARALIATILCFPIGSLALKNVYKLKRCLENGRRASACRHSKYVYNLSNAAIVIGTLFWCIAIVVMIIHLVILKKNNDTVS